MRFRPEVLKYIFIFVLFAKVDFIKALPTDNDNSLKRLEVNTSVETNAPQKNFNLTTPATPLVSSNVTVSTQEPDLETSESEQKEQTFVGIEESVETPDNVAASSTFDPSIYGGLISPDAFHQYVNQFGTVFPYAAPYPAPVYPGYVPPPPQPVYPSPYVVQTGYEGFLVPTATESGLATTTSNSHGNSTSTAFMYPFGVLSNIISTLMMSTIFKIVAGVISTLGMIFFSGAIMNFMCSYTPICDISFRAVTYLKRRDTAERVGRMITEGMTPERFKRAAEFVRNAIQKYQELQEFMEITNKNE